MASFAFPVILTLTIEVVYQINASATVVTRVRRTVVEI